MGSGTPNDKKFNIEAFKYAIGMLESSGGKFLNSRHSSAAGKYHFLWNLIKGDDNLKGISKREFINDSELQETIMNNALTGKLKGYPNYIKYAKDLKGRYGSDLDATKIAALTHFLGSGNVKKYLADPSSFKVAGKNMSPDEYLSKFDGYFNEYKSPEVTTPKQDSKLNDLKTQEFMKTMQPQDNTRVKTPELRDINSEQVLNINNQSEQDGLEFHSLKLGGSVGANGDNELVRFESGGRHHENPLGGIPQGMGANGKVNLVEEGETKWNDYVFSDSITIGAPIEKVKASANSFKLGGGVGPGDPDPTHPKNSPSPSPKPLTLTKQNHLSSPTVTQQMEIPDVRENYMEYNFPEANLKKTVNFSKAVKDLGSEAFLERYNNPITRQRMKAQARVTDADIDNMLLKGLNANKQVGGNSRGSKASYHDDTIFMGEDYKDDHNVENHDRVHASGFDAAMGLPLTNLLGNAFQQEGKGWLKKTAPDILSYLNQPHEAYGNFVEFRSALGLKPGEQIDKATLEKMVKDKGLGMENFYRAYNTDKIVEALNTIAYQDNNTDSYTLA